MNHQGGFDTLLLPGAEEGEKDQTLFIDSPDKLPMWTVCLLLAIVIVGQAPTSFTLMFARNGVVAFVFMGITGFMAAVAIRCYILVLERDVLSPFVSIIVSGCRSFPVVAIVIVSACLVVSVSTIVFNWQILFGSFLSCCFRSDLTVLFRFVAIVIFWGFSIPVGYLWTRAIGKWVVTVHCCVLGLYVLALFATSVTVLVSESTNPSQARGVPKSAMDFGYMFAMTRLVGIFPFMHHAVSNMQSGLKSRCERVNWMALGVIGACEAVFIIGEEITLSVLGNHIFESNYGVARCAQLFAALSQILTVPYFFPSLLDVTAAFFVNVPARVKEFQLLIVVAVTSVAAVLLALWNFMARILEILNSSFLIPIVIFALPAFLLQQLRKEAMEETKVKVCVYGCYAFAALQIFLGLFSITCFTLSAIRG